MRMSDLVAQYIIEMLDRENGSAEIQRRNCRTGAEQAGRE